MFHPSNLCFMSTLNEEIREIGRISVENVEQVVTPT